MNFKDEIFDSFYEGVFPSKDGQTFIVDFRIDGQRIYLSGIETIDEALKTMRYLRAEHFKWKVGCFELNPYEGVVTHERYVIFSTGELFNLYGRKLAVSLNSQWKECVHMNRNTYYLSRVLKEAFESDE